MNQDQGRRQLKLAGVELEAKRSSRKRRGDERGWDSDWDWDQSKQSKLLQGCIDSLVC